MTDEMKSLLLDVLQFLDDVGAARGVSSRNAALQERIGATLWTPKPEAMAEFRRALERDDKERQ